MLVCPACKTPGLKIAQRMKLAADMNWDERAIQTIECPACNACFRGEYLEERRGSRERFSHSATPITHGLFADMSTAIAAGDADLANRLAAREQGQSCHLHYQQPGDRAPVPRATGATPSREPTNGLFERLGSWLKN